MKKEMVYSPPRHLTELPADLVDYFNGTNFGGRIGAAIRLTTVDEDGWPHAAMLSVGEILAIDQQHLRFVISPQSTTTRNIERTGRVTLTLVHEGALWEIRLSTKPAGNADVASHNTAIFTATVVSVHVHSVPYADVISGVTYTLKDPDAVVLRWEQQISALRAAI